MIQAETRSDDCGSHHVGTMTCMSCQTVLQSGDIIQRKEYEKMKDDYENVKKELEALKEEHQATVAYC